MNKHCQIKVFIADDHPVVLYGIQCMLSKHEEIKLVGTAISGDEIQQKLPEALPNVLLLDLNMPGKDFYENIAWVKRNAPWVKILAHSGYYSPELVRSLLHEGAKGYLYKSATPEEVFQAISTVAKGEVFISSMAHAHSDNSPNPDSHPMLQDDFRKRLGLSRREQEVLMLISKGLSSQRIGQKLYISKYTVETHRKNILRKLDFNSSTELVKFAVQHGLV